MNIEFNTNRATRNGASQPVARREAAPSAQDNPSSDRAAAIVQQLNNIPVVRPEKVEKARALIADVKYPPNEMMDRIASLLAMHIKP